MKTESSNEKCKKIQMGMQENPWARKNLVRMENIHGSGRGGGQQRIMTPWEKAGDKTVDPLGQKKGKGKKEVHPGKHTMRNRPANRNKKGKKAKTVADGFH